MLMFSEPFQFDHGAQFFTVKTKKFNSFLLPYLNQGHIARWDAEFVEMDVNKITAGRKWDNAPAHYVGVPRMSKLGERMANGLTVLLNSQITRLEEHRQQWTLYDQNDEALGEFDWVITAIPAKQSADLLPPLFEHHEKIKKKKMHGCYSLMLGFEEQLEIKWQAALVTNTNISWISVDSSKPKRPDNYALLVHSTNQWAEDNMEADQEDVKNYLCTELEKIIGISVADAVHIDLHRWRYANTEKQFAENYYLDASARLAAIGDWCIHGRIESAFLSGYDLAQQIKQQL